LVRRPFKWVTSQASRPSSAHPPLYSIYLAAWSWLGLDGITVHRLAPPAGAAAVLVVGIVGWRIAGQTGLVAATIAALYPEPDQRRHAPVESMAVLVTALTSWSPTSSGVDRRCDLGGVRPVCGLAASARGELLLLFPCS
jgi:hypothetical protein